MDNNRPYDYAHTWEEIGVLLKKNPMLRMYTL